MAGPFDRHFRSEEHGTHRRRQSNPLPAGRTAVDRECPSVADAKVALNGLN